MADPNLANEPKPRPRMSTRNRVLFFVVGWLIVLMPFLFWWNTWFGRGLSDKQLAEYLHDSKHPRHIQHALVQLGERMSKSDSSATRWYPDIIQLSSYPVEEVRNTDAWAMGQDTNGAGFHDALLKMLDDSSPTVRGNAALSLVRFGDQSGRTQILALLQSATLVAPAAGKIADVGAVGTAIRQHGLVAKIKSSGQILEVRSPINGRVRDSLVTMGQKVSAGEKLAVVDPDEPQVWEALRALLIVGQPEDLPLVQRYEQRTPEISKRVQQQAEETDKAIQQREPPK
jgi:hypothetical protein